MDIIIHGATGRMGRAVTELAIQGFAGASPVALVSPDSPEGGAKNCYTALSHYTGPAHCLVDFSHHSAVNNILVYCMARGLPAVIATTGHTEDETARIQAAAQRIPIFFSANMSVGVAVLTDLARRTAAMFPKADVEIVECHHNRKLDVPSGTALLLGRAVQSVRPEAELVVGRHENGLRRGEEIGIHSLRMGNEVGMHEVILSTGSETITLTHRAESRTLFAEGALTAAAFLQGKPAGLYTMESMIKER